MLLREARLSAIAIVAVIVACGGSAGVADEGLDAGTGGDSSASGGSSTGGSVTGGATSGGPTSGGAASSGGGDLGGSRPSSEIDCVAAGDGRTTLALVNRCAGALTYAGSDIPGGTLAPGAWSCV